MKSATKYAWGSLGPACVMVIGIYAYTARSGLLEWFTPNAADTYYNLLVQGFRDGQLGLKREVPPGLARLADPYDPAANAVYRALPDTMLDISYYKGRLYLYFGITPALILFWPYAALTGRYLFHREAVLMFCGIGFLASVGLLRAVRSRYFPNISAGVLVACIFALGLGNGILVLLSQSDVYEVAISCGYMLTMLSLAAIWRALHEPARKGQWLAAASLTYGLAVGARPSLLFGAVILLVPVAQTWRERKQVWSLLAAAIVPIAVIGLALMVYNVRRFDDPFEFGVRYQLGGERQLTEKLFGLDYFWFNFRIFFLKPAHWSRCFPFVRNIAVPPFPPGYGRAENPFGVLTNVPLVWLALAVPLAWRARTAQERLVLRWFFAGVAVLIVACAMTACCFRAGNFRYELEFLPELVLLAVVGIFGLERALAPTQESGLSGRRIQRRLIRWGWSLLLGFSVVFNLLASVESYAEEDTNLGVALDKAGRLQEAIVQYEHALRIRSDYAKAHNNLGVALRQTGKIPEAIRHYEQALRINPHMADVHNNLGFALARLGRVKEAIEQYRHALRLEPDLAETHFNLGVALEQIGRIPEAIEHYDQAVRFRPGYTEAENNLAWLLATLPLAEGGNPARALALARHTCELTRNRVAPYLDTLAAAYAAVGRFNDAIATAERAVELARSAGQAQTVREIETHLDLYRVGRPCQHSVPDSSFSGHS